MNHGKFFIAHSFRIERYTIWTTQENHGWMNITLIRTNTSLRSLSVVSLNRIRIFPIPTQRPSIDNSVAKQPHRMRSFWRARCLATYKIKHSLVLDFITEHEKGFHWILQSKLCVLMEARENHLTIVRMTLPYRKERTYTKESERERDLVGDDNILVLPSLRCMESIWHCVCAHIFIYLYLYMTLICKQQLHLLHTNTVTVCVCVQHESNPNTYTIKRLCAMCACYKCRRQIVIVFILHFITKSFGI